MYESGVAMAFILWCIQSLFWIAMRASQLNRNLKKVGMRIGWTSGQPELMSGTQADRSLWLKLMFALLYLLFGLVLVIFSWLNVAVSVAMWLYRVGKDRGAPQHVREIRWKLRNMELQRDEILRLMLQLTGQSVNDFDAYRQEFLSDMASRGLKT